MQGGGQQKHARNSSLSYAGTVKAVNPPDLGRSQCLALCTSCLGCHPHSEPSIASLSPAQMDAPMAAPAAQMRVALVIGVTG